MSFYYNKFVTFLQKYSMEIIGIFTITFFVFIILYIYYMYNKVTKVVVFDLDETLGEFVELGIFCDVIEKYNKKKLTFKEFYEIFEIFPEFLRPNILKILSYLKIKKQQGECDKVIIYTNNQGPKEWSVNIKKFLEKKINYNLFNQVIAAYKINGKQIEYSRTTHDKTIDDLISCCNLPANAKICFLDDLYHEKMDHENVYYIHLEPYNYSIPFNDMAERYYNANSNKIENKDLFYRYVINNMSKYNYNFVNKTNKDKKEDIQISKEIFEDIQNFFKIYKNNKSKKIKNKYKKNRTLKSYV